MMVTRIRSRSHFGTQCSIACPCVSKWIVEKITYSTGSIRRLLTVRMLLRVMGRSDIEPNERTSELSKRGAAAVRQARSRAGIYHLAGTGTKPGPDIRAYLT